MISKKPLSLALCLSLACSLTTGCSNDPFASLRTPRAKTAPTSVSAAFIDQLTTAETEIRLGPGESRQLKVSGILRDGKPAPSIDLQWSSSDARILEVDNAGTVKRLGPGKVDVTATLRSNPGKKIAFAILDTDAPGLKVATLAGNGLASARDGQAAEASFNGPNGVALDSAGNLLVADRNNHRIRKISPAGQVALLAGSGTEGLRDGPAAQAQFSYPSGIAVDPGGNIYVSDTRNHTLRKISPAGTVSTLAGNGRPGFAEGKGAAAQFNFPMGIAVDSQSNVYVADMGNQRIRQVTPAGQVSTLAGSGIAGFQDGPARSARFRSPMGIAFHQAGQQLYISDTGNHQIRQLLVNQALNAVPILNQGIQLIVRTVTPSEQLKHPTGLAVDQEGNVYVADSGNQRLRKITSFGTISTVAGSAKPGFGDGQPNKALFSLAHTDQRQILKEVAIQPINLFLRQQLLPIPLQADVKLISGDRSTNVTWSVADLTTTAISSLLAPPGTNTVYAGTRASGILRSTDGGQTWAVANEGLPDLRIQALAFDAGATNFIYAGTRGGGVFKSADGGNSWQEINNGLSNPFVDALAQAPGRANTIYAGTRGGGVFKTIDGGNTWGNLTSGLSNLFIRSLAVDPARPDIVYAGTSGGGLFKSANGGTSWGSVNRGLGNLFVNAIAIDPVQPDTVFIGTAGSGVFKTSDGGGNWQGTQVLSNQVINALGLIPQDTAGPTSLYAATNHDTEHHGGLFKSKNNGQTWELSNDPQKQMAIQALAVLGSQVAELYSGSKAGKQGGQIAKMTDNRTDDRNQETVIVLDDGPCPNPQKPEDICGRQVRRTLVQEEEVFTDVVNVETVAVDGKPFRAFNASNSRHRTNIRTFDLIKANQARKVTLNQGSLIPCPNPRQVTSDLIQTAFIQFLSDKDIQLDRDLITEIKQVEVAKDENGKRVVEKIVEINSPTATIRKSQLSSQENCVEINKQDLEWRGLELDFNTLGPRTTSPFQLVHSGDISTGLNSIAKIVNNNILQIQEAGTVALTATSIADPTFSDVKIVSIDEVPESLTSPLVSTQFAFTDDAQAFLNFKGLAGLAVDSQGNLYIGDIGNHRIRKIGQ